ncbi:pyridoxal phosphate-dependent aminotransferase family protein [uncultured Winogradskyella sp.]|uniref:aminotransferase class I/II-fold pyridoxal phosphate-dependent enzyme n=1 Tax=uncultured Winogradskyella sp. TaxID=395353 RepID=UPI002628B3A5|nr:pyridoxal phosphate-dependent aminotransferase family protein [uncultured Winogradskyella sp.]
MLPKKLDNKLKKRKANNAFRQLGSESDLIDFSSNDYLGFSTLEPIFDKAHQYILNHSLKLNGATGSRLLSGNHSLYSKVENQIAQTHNSEAALIFNSGYDANIGLLSSIPQRGDLILFDELVHASIRDGITMSNAKSYKYKHNDLEDLDKILKRVQHKNEEIYIITESAFSMDGDSPDIQKLVQLCKNNSAHLIIDEAHAIGVFNKGLVQQLRLENDVFARIITFGKALGCHGATILGSQHLKDYLINFSRSFIYTTALPPHTLATIKTAYDELIIQGECEESQMQKLKENIAFFKSETSNLQLQELFIKSDSAIHCCIVPGNEEVKTLAQHLQNKGFDVKPILSPTVPVGKERLRFCLHSYNSKAEITNVLEHLAIFVKK